jgi:Flp pilus assembly protein TadB
MLKRAQSSARILDSIERIKAIDERSENHTRMLERLTNRAEQTSEVLKKMEYDSERSAEALISISSNTNSMSATLRDMHEDNKSLVGILAGKRQVPLSVFFLVVAVLLGIITVLELRSTGYNLEWSEGTFKLQDKGEKR